MPDFIQSTVTEGAPFGTYGKVAGLEVTSSSKDEASGLTTRFGTVHYEGGETGTFVELVNEKGEVVSYDEFADQAFWYPVFPTYEPSLYERLNDIADNSAIHDFFSNERFYISVDTGFDL